MFFAPQNLATGLCVTKTLVENFLRCLKCFETSPSLS